MKKYIIFIILISLSLNLKAEITVQSLYEEIKTQQSKIFPVRFQAEIKGDIVDKQISTVPSSRFSNGREKVQLMFYFKQKENPTLVLENVDSFYRNMFAIFEPVLETTGFYAAVGIAKNYSEFSKRFLIKGIEDKENCYEALAQGKGDDATYTVRYKINKENMLVESAVYFVQGIRRYDIAITYQNVDNYKVPDTIKYTSADGTVNSSIHFVNVKTFQK